MDLSEDYGFRLMVLFIFALGVLLFGGAISGRILQHIIEVVT